MSNKEIKVSIIVPIYNTEKYLKKCLDSLINQTLKDIEIICINDCSVDNSLYLIAEYKEKDNRIKIINHEINQGVAISRNNGLKIAQGEYVGFVDSDDWVDLNFFEVLYNRAIKVNADIIKGNVKKAKNNKFKLSNHNKKVKKNITNLCAYGWISCIYRMSIIKEHDINFPNISHGEDDVFLTHVKLYSKKISIVDDVFYYYLQRNDSATSQKGDEISESAIKCRELQIELFNNSNISRRDYIDYITRFERELYWDKLELLKHNILNNSTIFKKFKFNYKYKKSFLTSTKLYFSKLNLKIKFFIFLWRTL